MRKRLLARALAVCGVTLISGSVALAGDNWVGTWKLNTTKSTFSPGPGPKSLTLKFESVPEGIKLTSEGVNAEGEATRGGYVSKFDGKEVPMTGNPERRDLCPQEDRRQHL